MSGDLGRSTSDLFSEALAERDDAGSGDGAAKRVCHAELARGEAAAEHREGFEAAGPAAEAHDAGSIFLAGIELKQRLVDRAEG